MSKEIAKGISFFIFLGLIVLIAGFNLSPKDPKFLAALAVSGIVIVILLFSSRTVLPESDLHGSAKWATSKDLVTHKLVVSDKTKPAPGALILGPAPDMNNSRVDLPEQLMLRHTVVLGPSGSGKGRGFFLWQLPNFNGSFVYADPKGEGWRISSGYRQHSRRYAPREPDNSFCFNWIPLCGKEGHLCLSLAQAVILSSGGGNSAEGQFWVDTGSFFLAAVFAHTSTFTNPTPAAAYDLVCTIKGEELVTVLLNSTNQIAREYATLFSAADPKLRGNIMIGATAKLIWLADDKVRRFTSASLQPPDFGELRKKNVAVYWVLSEQDVAVLKPLSTLFFTLVLHQIKNVDEKDGKIPVCLLLDEVANIGRIPNLEVEIAVIRGRGIGLVLGLQSLAQLNKVYGQDAGKIIADNCNTKVVLAGLDVVSAEYVSKGLGKTTISEIGQSKSKQPGLLGFGKEQITEQVIRTGRDLLTPDEVIRLGDYDQVVLIANKPPIMSHRYWFTVNGIPTKANKLGETLTVQISPTSSSTAPAKEFYPKQNGNNKHNQQKQNNRQNNQVNNQQKTNFINNQNNTNDPKQNNQSSQPKQGSNGQNGNNQNNQVTSYPWSNQPAQTPYLAQAAQNNQRKATQEYRPKTPGQYQKSFDTG